MPQTVKDNVLLDLKADGPCTFDQLVYGVSLQCEVPKDATVPENARRKAADYWFRCAVVAALNELVREGTVKLYETGDAWDMA